MPQCDTTVQGVATAKPLRPRPTCQRLGAACGIGDLGLDGHLHQKANAQHWPVGVPILGPDERSLPAAPVKLKTRLQATSDGARRDLTQMRRHLRP